MKGKLAIMALAFGCAASALSGLTTLRYAHMNPPDSIAGKQAAFFAEKVEQYTKGAYTVEVYPSSQLGTLEQLAAEVAKGMVSFHHNTAAGIGSLFEDFSVLDTPFIYRDVKHLLKATEPSSPIMQRLNEGLVKKNGVRVLYTFYFGARQLTCDRPIRRPEDLSGLKIRSIPFPIPTPIDWSQTPTALAAKVVNGQENPVNTILTSKIYETQSYIMLTNHILGAEIVVVNDSIWQKFSKTTKDQVLRAAKEAGEYGTRLTLDQEASDLLALKAKGMKVIGPNEGLDIPAFERRTKALVDSLFGAKWSEYYKLIQAIK
jgi:tripartite ATP-independent transporter DctP family solute receptor